MFAEKFRILNLSYSRPLIIFFYIVCHKKSGDVVSEYIKNVISENPCTFSKLKCINLLIKTIAHRKKKIFIKELKTRR